MIFDPERLNFRGVNLLFTTEIYVTGDCVYVLLTVFIQTAFLVLLICFRQQKLEISVYSILKTIFLLLLMLYTTEISDAVYVCVCKAVTSFPHGVSRTPRSGSTRVRCGPRRQSK